jgi:hypothetical protein
MNFAIFLFKLAMRQPFLRAADRRLLLSGRAGQRAQRGCELQLRPWPAALLQQAMGRLLQAAMVLMQCHRPDEPGRAAAGSSRQQQAAIDVDAVVKTIKISGKEFNYADGTAEVRMLLLLLPAVAHILPAQWLQLDRQERKQATWAKHLTAAVDRYGCPKLKCRCCDQLLSAANPSDTHLKHVDKETGQCKTAQKLPPAPATGAHLCAGLLACVTLTAAHLPAVP